MSNAGKIRSNTLTIPQMFRLFHVIYGCNANSIGGINFGLFGHIYICIYIYMSKYCRPIRRHTYYYMFIDLQPHMIRRHWLCWLICVGGFCDLWARMRYKFCDFGQYGFWGLSKFVCVIPIWIPSIPFHINVVCWYYLNRIDIVRCVHRPQTFRCEIVLYIQNIWYVQWSVSFLCWTTPNQSSNGSNQLHIHPLWI